ncbi:sigma-70 family RNA polymerase sigma factor [Amycolatopsis granulosa]|uniref:sigma-70 family RNA polymerase sigma factor n=1 Tax=Amycolatopsis granulosa TaxID=185684 RepID=UPI0014204140|nr:sigma-70 family RNA polymerase sigma factor [Amycolatopsis granulosa]NIH83170.1 RNA polymerase sigma factor (sigma-70 family) [Amycolatopsis granulosa]
MAGDTDADAELIGAVRGGDLAAYDTLFRRHLPAARRVAAMLWRDRAEVDDLVAESFLRVFAAIRDGAGPADRFRPYLLVTLRNLAMDWGRRRERCDPWAATCDEGAPGVEEIVIDRLTGEVARSAFETLPPRWRYVLWHTEMLGTGPGKLAGELGMTANGVAALALRAREGLRQAFLQAHVPAAGTEKCRTVRRRLPAWTRGKVTARQRQAVSAHLARCPKCHRIAAVLERVNGGLPALVPLLGRLLGGGPAAPAGEAASVAAGGAPAASAVWGGASAALSKVAAAATLAAVAAVTGPVVTAEPPPGIAAAAPVVAGTSAVPAPAAPVRRGPAAQRPTGAQPETGGIAPVEGTAGRGMATNPGTATADGSPGGTAPGAGPANGYGRGRGNGAGKGDFTTEADRGGAADAPGRYHRPTPGTAPDGHGNAGGHGAGKPAGAGKGDFTTKADRDGAADGPGRPHRPAPTTAADGTGTGPGAANAGAAAHGRGGGATKPGTLGRGAGRPAADAPATRSPDPGTGSAAAGAAAPGR